MDELVSLMESNDPEDQNEDLSSSPAVVSRTDEGSGMDELAALMEDSSSPDPVTPSCPPYTKRSTTVQALNDRYESQKKNKKPVKRTEVKPADVSVDDKLGIRMVNRKLSSIDLLDMMSTHPYHSPAALSAMSLSALCRILIDPPTVVDSATVTGRTQLVTVGLVFHNSGTRTSSRGGAFCIITIGNFSSGPCLSIFLFGAAYSKYCRECTPGQVVAVSCPKLLPPRDNKGGKYDTSISLSVQDMAQFVMVAKAKDYAVCSAKVRVRQPDGSWTATGRCKNYVDRRICEFCDVHRRQKQDALRNQPLNDNPMHIRGATSTRKPSTMAELLKARNAKPTVQARNSGLSTNVYVKPPTNGPMGTANHPQAKVNMPSSVPKHMKRDVPGSTQGVRKPLIGNRCKPSNTLLNNTRKPTPREEPKRKKTGIVGGGDWLQDGVNNKAKKRPSTSLARFAQNGEKKRRSVSTIGGGFDGSVVVPKASRLFAGKTSIPMGASSALNDTSERDAANLERIQNNQAQLAQLLKDKMANPNKTPPKAPAATNKSAGPNAFLDGIDLGKGGTDKVLNKKSRFAEEVDAEEYAKSRQRVAELEHLESSKEKRKGKDNKENRKLKVEWVCHTCTGRPRFKSRPMGCYNANHAVKTCRDIAQTISKTDQRTKLHDMANQGSSMRIGQGLDWSKPRSSRFS